MSLEVEKEKNGDSDRASQKSDSHGHFSVEDDVARCEFLISHASRVGVRLIGGDVRAVTDARADLKKGRLNADVEQKFYSAMSSIVARVPYPDQQTAFDLELGRAVVSHAARIGKTLDTADLKAVSEAIVAQRNLRWTKEVEVLLYDAMSRLTQSVAPVMAETVGSEARKGARIAIRNYTAAAGVITLFVLVLSCLLFIVKQITADISTVVSRNDPIAITMHNQLQALQPALIKANQGATPESLAQMQNTPEAIEIKESLQRFATNNRQLYSDVTRARGIAHFVFRFPNWVGHLLLRGNWGEDWGTVESVYSQGCDQYRVSALSDDTYSFGGHVTVPIFSVSKSKINWQCDVEESRRALEVDLPILNTGSTSNGGPIIPADAIHQGFEKIAVYQEIRAMAAYSRDIILAFVGSITGFLLPILYASLGACAAILRQLRSETATCMFHPEYSTVANRAHVTTAVIVGISIGLFSNLVRSGIEASPLAVAFVAGYASDKFFEFIDRLVHAMFPPRLSGDEADTGAERKLKLSIDRSNRQVFGRAGRAAYLRKFNKPL